MSPDLLQDLIPGRSKVTVNVGPTAGLDIAGILAELDRYPHGCAEQTTSRAMPLVYLDDVARRIGLAADTAFASACRRRSSACSRCRMRPAPSASGARRTATSG